MASSTSSRNSIEIEDEENNNNNNFVPRLEKFEPQIQPQEPVYCCLTITTVWTLIGLVLFIPGIAGVVIVITTVFVKIGIAINEHDPALDPESTLKLDINPIEVIFGIIKGGILMLHGYCVLSGLHGRIKVCFKIW